MADFLIAVGLLLGFYGGLMSVPSLSLLVFGLARSAVPRRKAYWVPFLVSSVAAAAGIVSFIIGINI